MSRHHPYGGPYDNSGSRRGGSSGFGPDRSNRSHDGPPRGRGFGRGRGRGGYASYDANGGHTTAAYNQSPPQGDLGGSGTYNSYDSGPTQDSYYQNGGGYANSSQYESSRDFSS